MNTENLVVTAFNSAYFKAGLTLIAAIHRTSRATVNNILVFDLGLTHAQRQFLSRCEAVEVVSFPEFVNDFFPGYLEPRQFAWKPCAIKLAGLYAPRVLWLDAGAMPLRDLAVIFQIIARDGIFLVSDEHPNESLTLPRAFDLMEASASERHAKQIAASCIGYKVGGPYQALIDQAYAYSQNPDIVRGPHDRHRHDQSIYSVLAARYCCPRHPWPIFGEFRGLNVSPDQVIYLHRRTHHDTSGLRVRWAKKLSVCLCTYEAEATIGRVLDALRTQQRMDPAEWEIVVVDNNSGDSTAARLEAFQAQSPCSLRLVHEPNPGLLFARRRGILEATGAVTVLLDDDMILDPLWLRQCLDFFSTHLRAGLVGGMIQAELESSPPAGWEGVQWMYGIRGPFAEDDMLLNASGDPLAHPWGGGTAVRTALAQELYLSEKFVLVGRTGTRLNSGEDIEFAWYALRRGVEFWFTPRLRAVHILPARRLTEAYMRRLRRGVAASCVQMETLRHHGVYPPGRRYAARLCGWAVRHAFRRPLVWLQRDALSRLAQAGLAGRLQGSFRVLRDSIRRYGVIPWTFCREPRSKRERSV